MKKNEDVLINLWDEVPKIIVLVLLTQQEETLLRFPSRAGHVLTFPVLFGSGIVFSRSSSRSSKSYGVIWSGSGGWGVVEDSVLVDVFGFRYFFLLDVFVFLSFTGVNEICSTSFPLAPRRVCVEVTSIVPRRRLAGAMTQSGCGQ